ncbi:MAG: universal stress protein [Ilumatobacteraceae bacterium]
MTTYVVGLDGSEHARDALAWARAVAGGDEQIVVAHSWEVPVTSSYEVVSPIDPMDVEGMARQFLDEEVKTCDDDRVSGRLVTGHAGRSLVDLAAAEVSAPATIVVGHGGSTKASLLLGSTAHYVIHHTETPVVVVRGELRLPVRRVVVGVDEERDDRADATSLAALRWAVELPGVTEVQVSHADFVPGVAAGPVREPGVESDEEVAEDDSALRAAIADATGGSGAAPNGAEIVPVVAAGTGAFALIEASRDVDLVVIGSRGRSGLVELITGSTGLEVLSHAHCAVAVVR